MKCYDVHVDNKGRLLIPKEIRPMFLSGARIIYDGYSSRMAIEPLIRGQVTAEVEVVSDPSDLVEEAWLHKVAIRPAGICKDNGYPLVRCIGEYNDVRDLLDSWGYPAEDFEEYILKEGE